MRIDLFKKVTLWNVTSQSIAEYFHFEYNCYRVYICVTLLRTLAASLLILIPLWNLDCFAWMCIYSTNVILWATLYDLSAKLCAYVHVCVPTPKATNNYSHTAFYVKIVTPCFTILVFLLHHSCLCLTNYRPFYRERMWMATSVLFVVFSIYCVDMKMLST